MTDSDGTTFLSWENLIYIADFLDTSRERNASLLGGEPALHPHFVDYVLYLTERHFHVTVFTSGIFTEKTLDAATHELLSLPGDALSFVCNINHPSICSKEELVRLDEFLKCFGHLSIAGFNIYQPDFSLDFIFPLILNHGLKRHLRLGLAHPIPGEKNLFVPGNRMKEMSDRFLSYLPQFERFGVTPGFDCGFPLCIFSDESIGAIYKAAHGKLSFGCGPAIDIGPDMSVWGCFPLSQLPVKSLYDFDSIGDVHRFFREFQTKLRVESGGIFDECDECRHRESGLCSGGCVAHVAAKLKEEPRIRFEELYQ